MPVASRFTDLPGAVRVAWFGAMFAIAASDGHTAREEILTVLDRLDPDGLSPEEWLKVRRYVADAPDLLASLRVVADQPAAVRYGVMIHLIDVAWADGTMAPAERERLVLAAEALAIPPEHTAAIEHVIGTIRAELDGEIASTQALAMFATAGVPTGAILE